MKKELKNWTVRLLAYVFVLLVGILFLTDRYAEKAADNREGFQISLRWMYLLLWGISLIGILLSAFAMRVKENRKDLGFLVVVAGHVAALTGSLIMYFVHN